MKVCCFTPPYYTSLDVLDDQRFTRLKYTPVVNEIHHLYRGSVQPDEPIGDVTHHQVTDTKDRRKAFRMYVSTVRSYVNNNDIDLLYCFDYRLLPPISVAAILARQPLIFECGSRWEHGFDRLSERLTWIPLLKTIFRSGVVDDVIALADHLNRSVEKLGAPSPTTFYPLTNKDEFLNCETAVTYPEDKVILYVGRISPEKGPQRLLKRFDSLNRDDVGLHFIGDNINEVEGRSELAQQIHQRAKRSNNVHYHGWVEYADLPPYYRGADIVALPSLTEGFPSVVAEALSTETPIVCSDIPAFKEIVDESFGYVADADSEAFTKAISSLLNNPEMQTAMGTVGRQFVMKEADRNQQLLSSILSNYS